jgi:hypothetical protein
MSVLPGSSILIMALGLAAPLLAVSRPRVAPWLLLVSALAGFALQVPGYVIAGPPFALAAVVGFVHLLTARRKVKAPGAWA